jgi:2-methylisocitrate lyase-like PEP mutase family enzyme
MTVSQADKSARFRALHEAPGVFVMPNPWDAGSARVLAGLGFAALATSSGASAGTLGRRDGRVTRTEALAHARAIVEATDLPVSADLEKGFGDAPSKAAETIRLAAEIGLVGGSIEDATGDPARPLYDIGHAAERVAAAAQAAQTLSFPFTLTARAENFLRGNPNLDDTIARPRTSSELARTCCSPLVFPTWRRCGPSVPQSRSRSTSWSGSRAGRSRWPSSRLPEFAGSASPPRSIAWR